MATHDVVNQSSVLAAHNVPATDPALRDAPRFHAPLAAEQPCIALGAQVGYVEEHGEGVMARTYREMPLDSIREGAGNIVALDGDGPQVFGTLPRLVDVDSIIQGAAPH